MSDENISELDKLNELVDWANVAIHDSDFELALRLLYQAAGGGHIYAMHNLAYTLSYTDQSSQAQEEVARWYRIAAEANGIGFAGSQNNLGDQYEKGHGVKQSAADAIYWYTRSALLGEPTAYWSLGLCFADGIGVQKDLVEAYFWLVLAVNNMFESANLDDAKSKLVAIAELMTDEQIDLANRKASEFSPYIQTESFIE
jgi:TPR repeat protein